MNYWIIGQLDPDAGLLEISRRSNDDLRHGGVFGFMNNHIVAVYRWKDELNLYLDGQSTPLAPSARMIVEPLDPKRAIYDGECELLLVAIETRTRLLTYRPISDANLPYFEKVWGGEEKQDFGYYLQRITTDEEWRRRLMDVWKRHGF